MGEEVNNIENNKKQKVAILIGVVTLLIAVLGATYAFFQMDTESNSSNTNITGSTPDKSLVTLQGVTSNLHLNISASDMSYDNRTKEYYGTDGADLYVGTEELGTKTIASVELQGGEATTKYSCTAKLTVSKVTDPEEEADTMLEVLQPGDMILQFKGNIISEQLDLSELKTMGSKEYSLSFKVTGNNPEEIQAYIKLVNKETPQNYLAGRKLNIDISTSELNCDVYIESFNYMKINDNSFDDYRAKIKNINFVDNTDTSKSTASWDLSDIENGTKAKSVMAWVEPIENESDIYNLYIGSEKMIKVISLEKAFSEMSQLEIIHFNDKLDTSETTTLSEVFDGLGELQELDVSKWDVSNVTDFHRTFRGDSKLEKLDLSNWDLYNANNTVGMFLGCSSLKLIDLRGSISIPLIKRFDTYNQQMFAGVPSEAILVANNDDVGSNFKNNLFLMFNGTVMTVEEYEQQSM